MILDPKDVLDFPPGSAARLAKEPDTRMTRCLLPGYLGCSAKCPEACYCNKLPSAQYLEMAKRKYGDGF